VSRKTRELYCGHASLCVCLSVCLSVSGCMPTLLHGPRHNLGEWQGMPPGCALLGGFAISAQVALRWQHYGNAWQSPAVICQAHSMLHACRTCTLCMPSKTPLTSDKIMHLLQKCCMRRSISSILLGVARRMQNVSEYMLVLALCLVFK